MDSNQLLDHVRALNKRELVEHEQRKQAALKRIRELREHIRQTKEESNVNERINFSQRILWQR